MSLSTTTGNAERLQRASGSWRMEFEQLVYNAPAILRPKRFAVLGEHAILQQLREFSGHEPLAKDAERLFARGALPDGTYIARNGRWLAEMRPEVVVPEPEEPAPDQLAPGQVGEMNERIETLESTVRALQRSLDAAMQALTEVASQPRAAGSASLSPRRDAPVGIATAAPSIPAPAPKPVAAAPTGKPITLPTTAALSDLVKSLAGSDATLQSADRADWAKLAEAGPVYAAAIQTNDGEDVGAMIMDVESSLRLAGALLMESEEMINSLLDEKMMSEEMLDAASEVCNTLMSAFNKISGNPHLRVSKLALIDGASAAWIADARKADDYRYSHGGRLSMAVR